MGQVIPAKPGQVAFYSAVTGGRVDTAVLDASYWVENLRRPVRFAAAVESVLNDGYRVLVESSPHPVLSVGMQETAEALGVPVAAVPTLLRDQGGAAQLARALGQAFTAGVPVDWKCWFTTDSAVTPPALVELPTYAFQRQHYWLALSALLGAPVGGGSEVEGRFWRAVQEEDLEGLALELGVGGEVVEGVLAPVLPVLASWRRGAGERARVDGWRYREEWASVPVVLGSGLSGVWVLVVPEGLERDSVVGVLVEALDAFGSRCVVVGLGAGEVSRDVVAGRLSGLAEWSEVVGVVSVQALAEGVVGGVSAEGLAEGGRWWCRWWCAGGVGGGVGVGAGVG